MGRTVSVVLLKLAGNAYIYRAWRTHDEVQHERSLVPGEQLWHAIHCTIRCRLFGGRGVKKLNRQVTADAHRWLLD